MTRRIAILLGALAVACATAAPAHAADSLLAPAPVASGLSAYGGHAVWSARDATGQWRLVHWHAGTVTALPVPTRSVPFDADLGPGAAGAPAVLYSRCTTEPAAPSGLARTPDWSTASGCDVYQAPLDGGTEQPLAEVNTRYGSETTPSRWHGDVAFARRERGRHIAKLLLLRAGARGNDRNVHCSTDQADQFEVEAVLRCVGVDRVEQDFAHTPVRCFLGPGDGVDTGSGAATMGGHFKTGRRRDFTFAGTARIHGEHQDLRAEVTGNFVNDLRTRNSRRIDGRLVRTEAQELVHLGHATNATTHSEGNEDFLSRAADDVERGLAVPGRGGDVGTSFIGPAIVVTVRKFHRITGVAKAFEVDAFDDAACVDIKAGYDADGYSHVLLLSSAGALLDHCVG